MNHHMFVPSPRDRTQCTSGTPDDCALSERDHDIGFMKDPAEWPQWPKLPLKVPGRVMEPDGTGFLRELVMDDPIEPTVYLGTIFDGEAEILRNPDRHLRFESFDALYDAGWRVD